MENNPAPRGPLRITIADDLMRHWVVEAPAGTASLRELKRYAALRFENLFGEPADGWEIEGDWHPSQPVVCQAIPKDLAAQLRAWAAQARQPIVDLMSCGARLKARCEAAVKKPLRGHAATGQGVWVSVGSTHCMVWWRRQGRAHRIATLRTDARNPWNRVMQEIQRVDASLQADGQPCAAEVRWASLMDCTEPPADATGPLRFERHPSQAFAGADRFASSAGVAVLLAQGGSR